MKELTGIVTFKPIVFLFAIKITLLFAKLYQEAGWYFLITNIFNVFDKFFSSASLDENSYFYCSTIK